MLICTSYSNDLEFTQKITRTRSPFIYQCVKNTRISALWTNMTELPLFLDSFPLSRYYIFLTQRKEKCFRWIALYNLVGFIAHVYCLILTVLNIDAFGIYVYLMLPTWWRHQMETFSTLLSICAGNSPVPGEFPAQRPVTRIFDVWSAPE